MGQPESNSKRGSDLHYNLEPDGRVPNGGSTGVQRFPWLAVVGLVLSAAGGAVEAVWWLDNGPTWGNLYRFLFAGKKTHPQPPNQTLPTPKPDLVIEASSSSRVRGNRFWNHG